MMTPRTAAGRAGAIGWVGVCVCVLTLVAAARSYAQAADPAAAVTLPHAVQRALDEYPSIQAAAARVASHEAGVDLAQTSYLPRLDSTLHMNRATRNNVAGLLLPGLAIPPVSGPVSDSTAAAWGGAGGLLLTWEPIDFGLRGSAVDLARAQVTRARAGAAVTRLEVGVSAADAFLRLAEAQETVRAARASLQRYEVFAGAVARLVENQLRPGADDSRAQAELAQARIRVIQAEQAEQVSRVRLAQWLGMSAPDVQIDTTRVLMVPPPPPPPSDIGRHPLAETQMAAVESVRAAQNVIGHAFAPRINVQTAYSVRGSEVPIGAGARGLAFDTPNWAAGFTATFPLLDWFALRERSRIEAHNERAERATYDNVLRELTARSQQALAEMDGARRVAENTPIQVASARTLEQQARARYDAGLANIVEVADAQQLLLQADVADAVARLGLWRALVASAAAQGDLSELLK
jgi:outer membrane protein TolC